MNDQKVNILSLADFKSAKQTQPKTEAGDDTELFEATMAKNRLLQDKLREERLKANKQVLKSYKIKGK